MPRIDNKKQPLKVLTVKNEQTAKKLEQLIQDNWSILNVAANSSVIVYILRK